MLKIWLPFKTAFYNQNGGLIVLMCNYSFNFTILQYFQSCDRNSVDEVNSVFY